MSDRSTSRTISEQLTYICGLLMKKYFVGPDPAMDAVQQAYSEIHGKQVENFYGLWYTAASRRLIDYIRIKSKERSLKEWAMPCSYQEEASEFERIAEKLKRRLSTREYALFERLRAGQSARVIAEETGVSEVTVNKDRRRMIRRCRVILSDEYPIAGWEDITADEPSQSEDIEMLFPDGSTTDGYRIDSNRFINESGHLLKYVQPTQWRPL